MPHKEILRADTLMLQVLLYAKHMFHEETYRTIAPLVLVHSSIHQFQAPHTVDLINLKHVDDINTT